MNPAEIETIFFDLDNTLFDHTRAERATLGHLLQTIPGLNGIEREGFLTRYDRNNRELWRQMAEGTISGDELRVRRFEKTFGEFGVEVDGRFLSKRYMEVYSGHGFTVPGALDVLDYLKPRYALGILSNGFVPTQKMKLANARLGSFFKYEIYSGDVGAMKPAAPIFHAAAERCGSAPERIVFIGDSYESDIEGARAVGWHTIWFDYDKQGEKNGVSGLTVSNLRELLKIF